MIGRLSHIQSTVHPLEHSWTNFNTFIINDNNKILPPIYGLFHIIRLTPKVTSQFLPENSEKQPLSNARQITQLWDLSEDMQLKIPQLNLVVYIYNKIHARILHHLLDHNIQS